MSAMTNTFETYVLNAARGTTTTAPAKVYVGLFLLSPTETGTAGPEASYTGYARQEVTFGAPTTSGTTVSCSNSNQITFPTPDTAAGTVTYAAICDAASGGNVLVYKQLTDAIVLTNETSPRFAIGEIVLSMIGGDMSATYKTKVLNFLRGSNLTGFSPYLAMYDGDPANGGTELAGAEYARVALTFGAPAEQVSGQMQISNSAAAQSPSATSDWGSWQHTAIMTAATSGDIFYSHSNAATYPMKNGAQAYIAAGAINLAIN